MFKIVRFPFRLEKFFSFLKPEFRWNHFEYFRTLVLLVAFAWGRRNVSALYRYLDNESHRSRFNNFFIVGRWDPVKTLNKKALQILRLLKPSKGDIIYLIFDDSKKKKCGKKMDAVGKMKDPLTGEYIMGHQYINGGILFRGFFIPYCIRLYVKKEQCEELGIDFYKTTQFVAQFIREFAAPRGVKVEVLFDSYYLCPVVVNACQEKKFHFISVLKSNRNLFKRGRKLKAGKYGKNLFRRKAKKKVTILKENGKARYQYVDAGWMSVSRLGELHVVFSRKKGKKKILGLVTDDPEFLAKDIIVNYDKRWTIEQFFKDTKQILGLGQYQNGSYRAAVIHLHLVCFAYALLTHLRIKRYGAQGKRERPAWMSTNWAQNELRRIVWDDLVEYLEKKKTGNEVIKELNRLLVA